VARLTATAIKISHFIHRRGGFFICSTLIETVALLTITQISWGATSHQFNTLNQIEQNQTYKEDAYDPYTLLVKVSKANRSILKEKTEKSSGLATGSSAIDKTIKKHATKSFERVAVKGEKSKVNSEFFGWYKVSLDPNKPITAIEKNGKVYYSELENFQQELEHTSGVEKVEKDYITHASLIPNDTYYSSSGSWGQGFEDLWGVKKIDLAGAWDQTTGSSNITVAVIDTGVDRTHPDMTANIWTNPNENPSNGVDNDNDGYINDYYGWNWCNNNNNTQDDNGHGTHVAGIIAAGSNNGKGITGVSWGAKIMTLKYLCADGTGSTSNAALALEYAADHGARISSNSYGCLCANDSFLNDAIQYEYDRGTIPVVAAGNSASDALDFAPAAVDGAITVGATDNTNALASFSNIGPRIDVVAPGVDILSLKSSQASHTCIGGSIVNTNYCHISGTSMATPYVSGLISLMLSMNTNLTTEQVRQILRTTSTDLGTIGRDTSFGSGLINANAAVAASAAPTVLTPSISNIKSRSTLNGSINILGSANGATMQRYVLEAGQGRTPSTWVTLASSTTPVTNNTLAQLDTSTLADSTYTFRLTETATNGKTYEYAVYDVVVDNFSIKITLPFNVMPIHTAVPITGTVQANTPLVFDHYVVDYGVGTSPSSYSMIGIISANNGQRAVSDGAIGTWDTTGLTSGQPYTLRITAYATNGSFSSVTTTLAPDAKLVNGWPKQLPGNNCTDFCMGAGVVFADLQGDGNKEVITAGAGNSLYAYNKDGSIVAGFPITIPSTEAFFNPPIVADLDGDLLPEIIINATILSTNYKKLYIFKGDGSLYPGWTPRTIVAANPYDDPSPSVGDIDGDGKNELVTVTNDVGGSTWLDVFKVDNSEVSGFPKNISSYVSQWIPMPPTLADIDKDGHLEILYAGYNKLAVFTSQGNIKSGWPITLPNYAGFSETIQGPPAIGDVNGDGNLEVIFNGQKNGAIGGGIRTYAYTMNGTPLSGWPYSAVTATHVGFDFQSPTLADIDGDGKDEVILGDGATGVIDDGTGKRPIVLAKNSQTAVSIVDFSGTGIYQVPGLYNHGIQWSNLTDLTAFWQSDNLTSLASNTFSEYTIPVADLDKNGAAEFATQLKNGNELYAYLWEMTGSSSHPKDDWPMFDHDPARTNHLIVGQRGADTTPPQVVLTSAKSYATTAGSVLLTANALDDTAVSRVEFLVDGTLIGSDVSFPYSTYWNTATASIGTHTMTVRAYDSTNNMSSDNESITITPPPDTTPPTVSLSQPSNGASVSGTVHMSVTASDDVGVRSVSYYVNSSPVYTTGSASSSYDWNSASVPNGSVQLSATATDTSGNKTTTTITITVANSKNADVNKDGVINIYDLSLVIGHWNSGFAPADVNHDGVVNIYDLSLIIGNWGK
jgi:subtilisin family serine protease